METIKVFLGMEIGRFDGYEYLKVLKTYPNGSKLCFLDHDTVSEPDYEYEAWDDLWLAQPDEKFGWYAHSYSSINKYNCCSNRSRSFAGRSLQRF